VTWRGPNPAKLRLTILTGSSRVDTFTGRDLPGTYTCCTARFIGKPLRPRFDVRDKRIQFRTRNGDPRSADAYSMTGIDLMFQWYFKRR
jgi:hypothetical protein